MNWKAEWLGCILYAIVAACYIANGPGYQYDEAILTHGAVLLLRGEGSPPFAHEGASWLPIGNRALPLMAISYVGSVKDYIVLPLFAVFGVSAAVARAASALMTLAMMWAGGRLIRHQAGNAAAAFFGITLGTHPTFVRGTTLDNGCVANWMLGLGVIALGADQFVRFPDRKHAFWLGVAAGFAIWCRANCVWFLFAVAVASILIDRREIRAHLDKSAWIIGGSIAGAAPFLLFQVASRGAIFRFMHAMQLPSRDAYLMQRLRALANVFVSSAEDRAIWNGAAAPQWQLITVGFLAAISIVLALVSRDRFSRFLGLTAMIVGAILITSRMPVTDHHLVGLIPFVAAAAAVAWCEPPRWRSMIGAALCALYLSIAIVNVASAIRGLRATGGVDDWSDAVNTVANDPHVKTADFLDWGLYNNLYVLSRGQLRGRELFWGATAANAAGGLSWRAEIAHGGTYLVPAKQVFPEARAGFLRALNESRQSHMSRRFLQRNGRAYADLYLVAPLARSMTAAAPAR